MLKKTIKYVDYNDNERTEDFYFNLSKAEITEMQMSVEGGLIEMLDKMSKEQNIPKLIEFFKDLILRSYGEKSPDGKRFVKSNDISTAFSQTEAYVNLYMELVTEPEKAAAFVMGIIPSDVREKMPETAALVNLQNKLPE